VARIVVVGGTGRIGSLLVEGLIADGHEAVAASPRTGLDAAAGAGVEEAVTGSDVVIDVSKPRTYDPDAVWEYFTSATANLTAAARAAGVGHYVLLAAVGTERPDDIPFYRAKAAAEELIASSGVPFTLAHATQFFEFAPGIADSATVGRVVRLPPAAVQPVAAADVAQELRYSIGRGPVDAITEIAGPDRLGLADFVRRVLVSRRDARDVVEDASARYFGGHIDAAALLPGPEARIAPTTLGAWLGEDTR
jgi:uncharacterized protein YbjT (DUF2867 family)